MEQSGSYFRGRRLRWDPDHHAIEQERQRWVYERVDGLNEAITDLAVDPEREYALHRDAFIETGDPGQLLLMLEYVR